MKKIILLTIISAFALACTDKNQNGNAIDTEQSKDEIWKVVQTKFQSWNDQNFEAHLKTYHPNWQRWSMSEKRLLKKEDIEDFWNKAKTYEEPMEVNLEFIDIDFWAGENVAVVHFVSTEKFKWIGPPSPAGKKAGDIYEGVLRWSDIYVNENDEWLCIGGHRDLSELKNGLKKLN